VPYFQITSIEIKDFKRIANLKLDLSSITALVGGSSADLKTRLHVASNALVNPKWKNTIKDILAEN
jgi:hypothetical protein